MMTETELLALAEKMAHVAKPQSAMEWNVLGVLILVLFIAIIGLAMLGRTLGAKLLEAKEDMRGLIVKLTEVVSTCTHVMQENKTANQESTKAVEALRQEVHTAGILKEVRSSPAARGLQP